MSAVVARRQQVEPVLVTIGRAAPDPAPDSAADPATDPVRFGLGGADGYDVSVFSVGLACCAVEFVAATMRHAAFQALGVNPWASEPGRAGLMVVSGTVTDKMAPAVKRLYDEMPEPKHVISFGSCANSGGPYWDSYCVTKGVDQLIPVDVYVPGCPPRPEALLAGIRDLEHQLSDAVS